MTISITIIYQYVYRPHNMWVVGNTYTGTRKARVSW